MKVDVQRLLDLLIQCSQWV